jgi:hypothetical protein
MGEGRDAGNLGRIAGILLRGAGAGEVPPVHVIRAAYLSGPAQRADQRLSVLRQKS